MAEPKPKRRAGREEEEPAPLEAGLQGPSYDAPATEDDLPPDDYLLLKVVEANGEHLRTMRWGLGLGLFLVLLFLGFGPLLQESLGRLLPGLLLLLLAGPLLGAGLHALARQLELLRRATAATDHFLFGEAEHEHGHGP